MKVIPSQPYETNSNAEYRVFDKLKEAYVNNPNYIAFHSLNLTKHKYKRFGEADFVIICEYGLFVFEVKGGGISSKNGEWYSIDRKKETHKIQNPFTQSESALHAINKAIKATHKFDLLDIPIGHGVIFPDVKWSEKSSEWDVLTICDSQKFKNFEKFLDGFFKYWHNKQFNQNTLTKGNIKDIAHFLRPSFEVVSSLYERLDELDHITIRLTSDQYKYLDIAASNDRVLCSGGAGTGKTLLAIEMAKRLARANNIVAIICKSTWLKCYIESKISNEFVFISTIDSVKIQMKRAGVDKYNSLIVDEGQDLFNLNDIAILDAIITNGLEGGRWYIFHDSNNQSGLFESIEDDAYELLAECHPAKIPLTINCRNSSPVVKYIENLLTVEMGVKEKDNGPKVYAIFNDLENGVALENILDSLLKNNVAPANITILSPFLYNKSSVAFLPSKRQQKITELDAFSIKKFPMNGISFASIQDFKGLENEVIILIDMYKFNQSTEDKVLYYVAMSRAKGLLNVIYE